MVEPAGHALLSGPDADALRRSPVLHALLDGADEPWLLAAGVRDDDGNLIDFRIEFVNECGAAASRMSPDAIVGRRYGELWPAAVTAGFLDACIDAVNTGAPASRRSYFQQQPGLEEHFDIRVLRCGDGMALRYVDVTEQVRQRSRSEAERRLRDALDSSLDGFTLLTALRDDSPGGGRVVDFRVDYINAAGLAGLNRTVEETRGARFTEVFPGVVESGQLAKYLEVVRTGIPFRQELTYTDNQVSSSFEVQAVPLGDGVALSYRDTSASAAQRRALERSELLARQASERATVLSDIAGALAETVTVAEVAEAIVTRVRAAVGADGVVVAVAVDDTLRVIRAAGYDGEEAVYAQDSPVVSGHPLAMVASRGEPAFLEDSDQLDALLLDVGNLPRSLRDAAVAFLPLIVSGRPVGSLAVAFAEPHAFGEEDRRLLGTLAGHCAQALERARLFKQEHDTAVSLQRALLPSELSTDPRMPVAVRYQPGSTGVEIGGDFYDVIPLSSGAVALVLGDVAGHNIAAAAVMGQVRNALRAYALEGHSPSGVMERTNRLLATVEVERLTTCAYLEIVPEQGAVTLVLAGHLPPVVKPPGGPARRIDVPPGPPLGVVRDARFEERTFLVEPGSLLVLYTDGLVETREDSIDMRIDRLVEVASQLPHEPEAACDAILRYVPEDRERFDDVALLVARTAEATKREGRIARTFPGDASSAPSARRFVADVLEAWQLPAIVDTAELVISELCTNAVLHTAEDFDVGVCLQAGDVVRVEVVDSSDRVPQVRDQDDSAIAGRGLHIVDMLAEEWGVDPAPRGKCVYATLRV